MRGVKQADMKIALPHTPTLNASTLAATAIAPSSPIPGRSNPFVGLRPFNIDESLLFFGRRQQTIELLERLHRNHFIAVLGSSGCGKSSLIRAGLIPKLLAGFLLEEREAWSIATLKPGDAPLRNLAIALSDPPTKTAARHLQSAIQEGGTHAILNYLQPTLTAANSNLLLLVDQFEELFRFGIESGKPEQRDEATDFVALLLQLTEQRQLPVYVVLTMRSDFLGECDNFYGLPEAFNGSQYLVPRLTRQQRQQAIEGPVRLFGATLSPRLLDRVLNDAGDKPDHLPVLQHALLRTWEHWRKRGAVQLDIEDYEAAGTFKNALSNDAEAALSGMTAEELKITEKMFQALTDVDANNRRVRRPIHLSELVKLLGVTRITVKRIIDRFRGSGRSFLTITWEADPLIDISHESLIRQWNRLGEWIETEYQSRTTYLRIVDRAKLYKKYEGGLLKGVDLKVARRWWKKYKPNLLWASRYESEFSFVKRFMIKSNIWRWLKRASWIIPLMAFSSYFYVTAKYPSHEQGKIYGDYAPLWVKYTYDGLAAGMILTWLITLAIAILNVSARFMIKIGKSSFRLTNHIYLKHRNKSSFLRH